MPNVPRYILNHVLPLRAVLVDRRRELTLHVSLLIRMRGAVGRLRGPWKYSFAIAKFAIWRFISLVATHMTFYHHIAPPPLAGLSYDLGLSNYMLVN